MIVNKRIIFLDKLRIISCIAVIVLHTVTYGYFSISFLSTSWIVCTIINCISRFCVPVFIGISGALFLSRDISIKDLYIKYILRIIVILLLCSTFYAVWDCFYELFNSSNIIQILLEKILKGYYHLWYLYLVIFLYILTPLLKTITTSKDVLKYTLVLLFITQFIFPLIINSNAFQPISLIINKVFFFNDSMGYIFYYLLGYYIYNLEITKKKEIISYIIGIVGFILTCYLTIKKSINEGILAETYLKSVTANVSFQYIGIFIFAKCKLNSSNEKTRNMISLLSKCSFAMYLCHPFVLDKIYDFCVLLGISNIYIRLLIMLVATIAISFCISYAFCFIKNENTNFNHQHN